MKSQIRDTKRIAKNTIALYICMALSMLITLYSSRLILQTIGVDDFGLYNVVFGVAALLSFMKTSLTSSVQRFLSFELGQNNMGQLKKVFCISVNTHILICILIILLSETIGLWFLNTQLHIAPERVVAANWIYQFSILSLCFSTLSVPYSADIISHERMTFYAFANVTVALLKFLSTTVLFYVNCDRLIVYGFLLTIVEALHMLMFWVYCRKKYIETKYIFIFDKELFVKIFSFSGWTMLGELSVVAANNGNNVLVNIYFNVAVNAAMGIAQQINNGLAGLTANFQTAFQPQIIKSYATKDIEYFNFIICKASKISYFLVFIVSIPVILNIDGILTIWLGKVPKYAAEFGILYLVASWMNALSAPLAIASYATGKIKWYQIVVSLVFFSDIIIVWLLFNYYEVPPTASMMVKVAINLTVVFVRLGYASRLIKFFSASTFIKEVMIPCIVCTILIVAPVYSYIVYSLDTYDKFGYSLITVCYAIGITYFIGMSKQDRLYINSITKNIYNKIKKSYV